MSTRGISWGVESSSPYTHDCIATLSLICTLLTCWSTSFSFTLTVICPLALPLTPLFIIYIFKHSLNFFFNRPSTFYCMSYPHSFLWQVILLLTQTVPHFLLQAPLIHSFTLTEQKYVAYNECLHFSQLPNYKVATTIHTFLLTLLSGVQTKLPVLDMLLKLSVAQTKSPVSLHCFHNHTRLHFNQLTDVCIVYQNSCDSVLSL